jgi:hypothetical protein
MELRQQKPAPWKWQLGLIVLSPLWMPLLLCVGVAYLVATIVIYLAVWIVWSTRGIHLVYVYSNSPHWQTHIEQEILPQLPKKQIVLNWSDRRRWRNMSLTSIVFHHFGGYRAFNPMAVIMRPFSRARVFRFYGPFKDFAHGKPDSLRKMETEFFQVLGK